MAYGTVGLISALSSALNMQQLFLTGSDIFSDTRLFKFIFGVSQKFLKLLIDHFVIQIEFEYLPKLTLIISNNFYM